MQTEEREKIAIIAGGGNMPSFVTSRLKDKFQILILNIADNPLGKKEFNYTEVGKMLSFLKEGKAHKVVFCGYVDRPKNLLELKPDLEGAKLLTMISAKAILGDNNILSSVRDFLHKKGIELLALNHLIPELVAEKSILTIKNANKEDVESISLAIKFMEHVSSYDIGQSVIIENKRIISMEDVSGTDALINRVKDFVGNDAILVKFPKKGQIEEIDLPAIGIKTIENMAKSNIKGVCIKAGHTLIIDQEMVIKEANRLGLFIVAM